MDKTHWTARNSSLLAFLSVHLGSSTYPTSRKILNDDGVIKCIEYAVGMLLRKDNLESRHSLFQALAVISNAPIELVKPGLITIDFSKL